MLKNEKNAEKIKSLINRIHLRHPLDYVWIEVFANYLSVNDLGVIEAFKITTISFIYRTNVTKCFTFPKNQPIKTESERKSKKRLERRHGLG